MYSVTLCNVACKPSQAREAERLYCQALDAHFGSAVATVAAFNDAANSPIDEAAWARADLLAADTAFAGWQRQPMGAHFELDTE